MKFTVSSYLLAFALSFQFFISQAQFAEVGGLSAYEVRQYTDENGLPQNSIKSITSDAEGNVWLATDGGLARFDGRKFKIFDNFGKGHFDRSIASFHINPAHSDGSFFAANDERTYIRIINGQATVDSSWYKEGIAPLPLHQQGIEFYLTEGLPSLGRDHIFLSKLVIPTGDNHFFIYDKKNVEFFKGKRRIKSFPLADRDFWGFFRLKNNLYLFENGAFSRFADTSPSFPEYVSLSGDILDHPLHVQGNKGVIHWNNCTDQVYIQLGKSLYTVHEGSRGELKTSLILEGFDFEANQITKVHFDQQTGRIFLGTLINGLFVLKKKPFRPVYARFEGADNVFYSQVAINNSVFTSYGTVFSYDESSDEISARQIESLSKTDLTALLVDSRGNMWSEKRYTIFETEPGGRVKRKWTLPAQITQLYEGRDGRIWIGLRSAGLYTLDPADPAAEPKLFLAGPMTHASWIQQQTEDILWVGTGMGLYKIHIPTRRVSYIKGLENSHIRSLHIPGNSDEIWISTYKDGFFLLKNGKLTSFPLDRNRHLANAHCIVEDEKGFFWISTNRGLFQILKKDLLDYSETQVKPYYHYYSKADGFYTNEFNGGCSPCAVRLANGYVSLPSIKGLVWFKPEQISTELPDKRIIVDRIEINGKAASLKDNNVTFRQDQRELRVFVTTPYFGSPENIHFSYALTAPNTTPSHQEWLPIEASSDVINILQLKHGKYVLHVRKQNGFGRGNNEYVSIEITVPPLWYQTWWFFLLCGIGSFLIVSAILKARVSSVKRRNLALESQIEYRTK
uniref:ligand-binding sensor domain-containing protein n=1 Tax=Dyadobacter crusticola TaxID=292407 RepID=UPI0004E2181D